MTIMRKKIDRLKFRKKTFGCDVLNRICKLKKKMTLI